MCSCCGKKVLRVLAREPRRHLRECSKVVRVTYHLSARAHAYLSYAQLLSVSRMLSVSMSTSAFSAPTSHVDLFIRFSSTFMFSCTVLMLFNMPSSTCVREDCSCCRLAWSFGSSCSIDDRRFEKVAPCACRDANCCNLTHKAGK